MIRLNAKIPQIMKQKQRSTDTELNGHSFKLVEEFCCLDDTVGNSRISAFNSVLPKTKNGCKDLRIYYLLLTIRYLALGVKEG